MECVSSKGSVFIKYATDELKRQLCKNCMEKKTAGSYEVDGAEISWKQEGECVSSTQPTSCPAMLMFYRLKEYEDTKHSPQGVCRLEADNEKLRTDNIEMKWKIGLIRDTVAHKTGFLNESGRGAAPRNTGFLKEGC